jgi:hypothetical protein
MAVAEHTDEIIQRQVQEEARRKVDFIRGVHAAEQLHIKAIAKYQAAVADASRICAVKIREARLAHSAAHNRANQAFDRLHPALKSGAWQSYHDETKAIDKARDDAIAKATADCAGTIDAAKAVCRQSGFTGAL